jgi:aspartate/glutamate racemase
MQVTRSDINLVKLMHQKLISAGAEGVILGCTELSTLSLGNEDKLIDPLKEILSVIMPLNQRNNV